MAKFAVMASELKSLKKSIEDKKLAELKKEIIEILKKQDEKDFKKAIDYFNSQELHYTHLEKSLNGKWIEKAGYGIGTVRIWKGKKYKKIAPGKWARVFEKEGRGTNIAIGKLIAKVQKIDNVEDLMTFVMANKQRFVDENGVDLPVLDKLRAAVDARNGNVGSKETSKPAETKTASSSDEKKYKQTKKMLEDTIAEIDRNIRMFDSNPSPNSLRMANQLEKQKAERQKQLDDLESAYKKLSEKPAEKKEEVDYSKMSEDELNELNKKLRQTIKEKDYGEADEEMEQINKISKQKIINSYKTKEKHTLQHVEDVEQKKKMIADSKAIVEKDLVRKEKQRIKESSIAKKNQLADEIDELKYKKAAFEQLEKEIESEAEKHQNRSDAMKGNKNAVKVGGDKKVIGTFTKKDDNSVEMDVTKENKVIFDSLNKALSKDKTRAFMTDVYYDGEYLNSTNGYSLVSVKVGDIGLDKGFVKVDSNNGKINVSAIPDKHSDYIPPYKTVIPENNNQEVNIDNKKLKQKLKAMKAEGAYTKDNPIIALEFKDGNVVLDDTVIGESNAKFKDDKNSIYFVADNLSNMITNNKDSTMFVSDNPEKAIAFSDDSSDIVLMPAKETVLNYEGRRNIKKEKDEYEAKTKQKQQDAMNSIVDTQKDSMSNEWVQSLIDKVNNKEIKNHKTIIEHAYKALKDAEKMIEKPTKKWTSSLANNKYGYSLLAAVRKNPDFKTALENMAMEYGLIKKSLFDNFIVDVFAADDEEEIEDELYEGETEYNDYSAEQPELFNSTSMKVREALDRIKNQVL